MARCTAGKIDPLYLNPVAVQGLGLLGSGLRVYPNHQKQFHYMTANEAAADPLMQLTQQLRAQASAQRPRGSGFGCRVSFSRV